MSRRRRASWWLAGVGLIIAAALLLVAQPGDVVGLAGRARWPGLLTALGGTAVAMLLRGLRLSLLAGRRLRPARATAVAAVWQLASGVLPLRLGELSLIPLLRAAGLPGTIRALSVTVLARVLDVLAVLMWAAFGTAAIGGRPLLAIAAVGVVAVLLTFAWIVGGRALRWLGSRWRKRKSWRRRMLVQLLRARKELLQLARTPAQAFASLLLSVLLWGVIWAVTATLLRAMALNFPPFLVLLGVIGAAAGSSLPVNAVGNFGTQEAGWAAALAGAGVAPRSALAAGFACHLWGLGFTLVIGAGALVYLAAGGSGAPSRPFLARLRSLLIPGRTE
ncbi:MAG: flippase-like domain-containing protein [Acidobacteriia bacterium]|nr:flippase-like domain-containing protein [Terriglobia bacterium]